MLSPRHRSVRTKGSRGLTCPKISRVIRYKNTLYLFGNQWSKRHFNSFLFGNKFLIIFIRIKVMQQCFLVNWSVFFVPWKYEAFPSIQVFLAKLRGNFSPCPARQEGALFLSRVLVAVITTDNNKYFFSYKMMKEVPISLLPQVRYRVRNLVLKLRNLSSDFTIIFTSVRIHLSTVKSLCGITLLRLTLQREV